MQGSDAFLLGAVEVAVVGVACFLRSGDERIVQRMIRPQIGHAQRAVCAMEFIRSMLLIFCLAEIGQHVVIRPARIAELSPQIKVLALAANIDQPVA